MSVKAYGGGGLKALADMSSKNVSFFWTAALNLHSWWKFPLLCNNIFNIFCNANC